MPVALFGGREYVPESGVQVLASSDRYMLFLIYTFPRERGGRR
jgi:hypothetical protein